MLKLLYKPTGNVFTLPDDEALKIKKADRGDDYVILEVGLKDKEEEVISEEEVKEIEADIEANKEAEEADKKEKAEKKANKEKKKRKVGTTNLTKMRKQDLAIVARKLGIQNTRDKTAEYLINKINELTGLSE